MSATVITITANNNNNNNTEDRILHLQCFISILWWNVGMTVAAGGHMTF